MEKTKLNFRISSIIASAIGTIGFALAIGYKFSDSALFTQYKDLGGVLISIGLLGNIAISSYFKEEGF